MRSLAVVTAGWLLGLVYRPISGQTPALPNILVLVADDLGWHDTGVYGNRGIHTPNIDRLARSGLRVQWAFGTTPQCSPSRISILSGDYAHATRTEDLHTPLPDGVRLLPSYLQEQGYFTGMMAKTHIGPKGERQFQWYSPETAAAFPSFLDAAGTRPFFLWVGFHDPHRPYERGPRTTTYSPSSIPSCANAWPRRSLLDHSDCRNASSASRSGFVRWANLSRAVVASPPCQSTASWSE